METNSLKIDLLIFVILLPALFFFSCDKQSELKEGVTPPVTEKMPVEQPQNESPKEVKAVTFSEFAETFIREAKLSEDNFVKYSNERINGQSPSKAYKTFISYSNVKPIIQEGSITFTKRSVSQESGDPIKHVYKLVFRKNDAGEWKLTSTSYKYDLDM